MHYSETSPWAYYSEELERYKALNRPPKNPNIQTWAEFLSDLSKERPAAPRFRALPTEPLPAKISQLTSNPEPEIPASIIPTSKDYEIIAQVSFWGWLGGAIGRRTTSEPIYNSGITQTSHSFTEKIRQMNLTQPSLPTSQGMQLALWG